ncbi:AlpA family phage regulatory protein [Enterobacter sp. JMULE2]|uniref:helix-turn-helix transcriptional regulator n=1 Tax=Enterobacter sp. JMULE2 TaxID=2518340 RepID=UPI001576683F|nr:AlpA family phage regulatory protein [Enterobacter sp. JMULE2]NTZ36198.1 AlpA family phage regulatory protein [Enterobacter sp. JMULE2]NTZ39603.1 AlpA family phage regulatory protein [Enterobacter sp. JMULE2]
MEKNFDHLSGVDRVIREDECKYLTCLAHTSRWRLEKVGKFPKRRKLGAKAVGWSLAEIQAWIRGDWHPGWKEEQKAKQ